MLLLFSFQVDQVFSLKTPFQLKDNSGINTTSAICVCWKVIKCIVQKEIENLMAISSDYSISVHQTLKNGCMFLFKYKS